MGLICTLLMPILCRYPTVLIPTPDFVRRPALWLHGMQRFGGTVSFAPNFAYSLCAKRIRDADLEGLRLESWRIAVTAAEPILAATCRAFQRRFEPFGFRSTCFTAAYGMAEYVTVATADEPGAELFVERLDRASMATNGSADLALATDPDAFECVGVGTSVRGTDFDIRDEAGRSLPDRRIGVIWIRGSSLFEGYRDEASMTEQSRVGGWFRTGDLGYRTQGRLFFVSREKDLIVIGGEKYSPQDVEQAVNEASGVRDGCVVAVGVQNEARGTEDLAVVAETKLDDPTALDRLRREIRSNVQSAVGLGVRHLLLVTPGGIEKTTSGKLARSATHRRYFDGDSNCPPTQR
jgi:fatty-acyl-CoA synthase